MGHRLDGIFRDLGISQYLETFVDQGFDSWDTILDITESDLDALGVKLGHRRKLQRRIANTRGIAHDVALGSPTSTRMSVEERFEPPRAENLKPSEVKDVGVTKRKYRRHPKPDENAPERPPSAYVLFSNKMREDLKGRNLSFTEIAKLVGENWQSLTPSEKEPFEREAQQAKEKYNNDLAGYKKTPEYHQYNQYLHEFKLKHSSGHPQDKDSQKRPRLEACLQGTLQSSHHHPGSTSSSTAFGGSVNRGNVSGTTSGDSQQGSEPPPSSHRAPVQQDSGSVSTTPLSYHRTMDEAMTSPSTHGSFFEPMDQSPKLYPQDTPHSGHRSRRSTSWKPAETTHNLPSLSDVFDSRQPFSQNTPEGTGYSGFMQTHHRSGPGPPNSAQSQSDLRAHPPMPTSLRKEHSSGGSMSSSSGSGTASGSGSISGSSSQGPPSSFSSFPSTPSEASLPLPIHAFLASKTSSHFDSPSSGSTQSSSSQQQSPPNDSPIYLHRQTPSRTTSTISSGGLDYSSAGNAFQSPKIMGYPPSALHNVVPRDGHASEDKAQQPQDASKEDPTGMDGMSALLRAGEIVDRRDK